MIEQLKLNNVRKIAVLRANALGDLIVTLPAFKALRNTYPSAEIVLLGKPWHKEFLVQGRSHIDRVVVVPVKKGIRNEVNQHENEEEIEAFINAMQKERFDAVINFQGNGVSANPFIKNFNAKLTVGLCSENAERLDRSLPYYYYQSEALRYLDVVRLIGAATSDIEPQINILTEDLNEIKPFLSSLQDKQYVVVHAVAMDIRRMWPIKNYAPLADQLRMRNLEVVFTGSVEDKEIVDEIIDQMKYSAINVCGQFSLGGLAALLSKASVTIGADTGPMHLARAVNSPTVGMYWAPNLINWGPLTRVIHRPLISWNMACPYCGVVPNDPYPFEPHTSTCRHEVSFVRDITVEDVMKEVEVLLAFKQHQAETVAAACEDKQ